MQMIASLWPGAEQRYEEKYKIALKMWRVLKVTSQTEEHVDNPASAIWPTHAYILEYQSTTHAHKGDKNGMLWSVDAITIGVIEWTNYA